MRNEARAGLKGWLAWTSAALIVAAGCGSSEKIEQGPLYPDATSYCAGRAHAECAAKVVSQCAVAAETCALARQAACVAAVPSGRAYRPAQAEACIGAVGRAYDDASLARSEYDAIDAACSTVFAAGGGAGTSCTVDAECAVDDGLSCVPKAGTSGSCQVARVVAVGDSCAAADAVCPAGTYCGSGGNPHCGKDGQSGEHCSATEPCDATLLCDAASSTCKARLADGVACTSRDECVHGLCLDVPGGKLCAGSVTFAPNEPICSEFRPAADGGS